MYTIYGIPMISTTLPWNLYEIYNFAIESLCYLHFYDIYNFATKYLCNPYNIYNCL